MILIVYSTFCVTRSCFCHHGAGRKYGGDAIREHILTMKSMKDGGNDEKRQDNSEVGSMERVLIDG